MKPGLPAPGETWTTEASSGWPQSLGSFAQSELGRTDLVGVEQWAEIRRLRFVKRLGIREIHRRMGLHGETIRRAIASDAPPVYRREANGSKLDPFREEIQRLLAADPKLPGARCASCLSRWGARRPRPWLMTTCARSARCSRRGRGHFQRTAYRPGEVCQFDVWGPVREIPVGHGQTRKGFVVIACLGYSRAGARALVFSKKTPDLLAGIVRCLWQLGGLPETLVWDRQAGIHGHGRPPQRGVRRAVRAAARRLVVL